MPKPAQAYEHGHSGHVQEEAQDHNSQLEAAGFVRLVGLHHERHEAETPGPHLPAQALIIVTMPVINRHPALVDERPAGPQRAVEHVQIAAAWKRPAGVERLVEKSVLQQKLTREDHVAARAERARVAGMRKITKRVLRVPDGAKAVAEPAPLL